MLMPNDPGCQQLIERPGYAKRADNFIEIVALADSFQGLQNVTWHSLTDTLFDGFSFLGVSEGAHRVLMLLCRHLTTDQWASGDLFVWPSNDRLANCCGASHRTIQQRLKELESAGLIIREYTRINSRMSGRHANRPQGGINLAPLGAKLAALRSAIDEARRQAEAERQARYARLGDDSFDQDISCRDEETFAHKQSHLNHSTDTVPAGASAPFGMDATRRITDGITVEDQTSQHRRRKTKERGSPGGEGFSSERQLDRTSAAETAHAAMLAAIQLSPTLSEVSPLTALQAATIDEILRHLGHVIGQLFPERNTALTWEWAVKRHGWRAALCLVAALEDPTVRDRYRMFGYLTTKVDTGQLDLSSNFKRIERLKPAAAEAEPAPIEAKAVDHHPTWAAIIDHLRKDLSAATVAAWIDPLNYRDIERGSLHLVAPSRFYADHVRQEFEQRLLAASRRVDPTIHRVVIEVSS